MSCNAQDGPPTKNDMIRNVNGAHFRNSLLLLFEGWGWKLGTALKASPSVTKPSWKRLKPLWSETKPSPLGNPALDSLNLRLGELDDRGQPLCRSPHLCWP